MATRIHTLDLNFQQKTQAIACYLIRGDDAVVLIESGPGSTLPALETALAREGLSPRDITHVLLTHIHLDHAGAAGWLSRQGAQIYVHPNGAAHLLNPEKLIASASRIYGDQMDRLWGTFLPVEHDHLHIPQDAEEIAIGRLRFTALNTPGHAEHHYAYRFEDLCFSGDAGGVRIPGYAYLRAPMPPPELHFERWLYSIQRLKREKFQRIAPTHFGIFDDAGWHLDQMERTLLSSRAWLEEQMQSDPPVEEIRRRLEGWMQAQQQKEHLSDQVVRAYALANPIGMSADGLVRYWKKFRSG